MRKSSKYLLLILILIVLFLMAKETKNKKDIESSHQNLINNKENIESSHQSGFYTKPFKLILKTDTNKIIRYTFDGSDPTNKSPIFSDPILITGQESNDFLSCINPTRPDSLGWLLPFSGQDNATIIKYFALDTNGIIYSKIKTLSFFIGLNKKPKKKLFFINSSDTPKYRLPIISISTNKENLFDEEKGIYVSGDDFKHQNKISGNYYKRGKAYERKVFFQYFTVEGKLDFELNIGMRIHGGITRKHPQKSLKFYARDEYSKEKINFPFLSNQGVNRFILESFRESGGGQALIEDIVAQEIVKELGLTQQRFKPVILFINGEYWGIYNLRDRLDENFLAYKFDIHKDSFNIIDGNPKRGYEIIHGSNTDYIELMNFIKNNDISDDINYNEILKKIDIENLIDYYSVEIFFANYDWPIHNVKLYQKKKDRWKFMLYDLDGGFNSSINNVNHSFNMFERICKEENYSPTEATLLFRSLMNNKNFRAKFEKRYREIITAYMQPERTIAIVDSISNLYEDNLERHIYRWRYPWTYSHWERDVEKNIKDFLRNRETETIKNMNKFMEEKKQEKL